MYIENPVVPIGFEFTFEPPELMKRIDADAYIIEKVEAGTRLHKPLERMSLGFYPDYGCLEINSPVFRNTEKIVAYYEKLLKLLKGDFIIKHKISTGGGCHIHSDVEDEEHALRIGQIIRNRPYLCYAFNDPMDDWNANPLGRGWKSAFDYDKSAGIRYAGEQLKGGFTVEFRFFDNPKKTEELVAYVHAVNHVYKLAKNEEKNITVPPNKFVSEFNKFKKDAGIVFSNSRLLQRLKNERLV